MLEGNSSPQRRRSLCVDVPDDDEVVAFRKRNEVLSECQVWTSVAQIERADENAQVARHRSALCSVEAPKFVSAPFAKAFAQRSRHLRSVDRGSSIYLVCEFTLLERVSARVRMGNAASAPGSPGDARSAAQQQRPQQQRPAYAPTPYSPTPYYPQARDCVALERATKREPSPLGVGTPALGHTRQPVPVPPLRASFASTCAALTPELHTTRTHTTALVLPTRPATRPSANQRQWPQRRESVRAIPTGAGCQPKRQTRVRLQWDACFCARLHDSLGPCVVGRSSVSLGGVHLWVGRARSL